MWVLRLCCVNPGCARGKSHGTLFSSPAVTGLILLAWVDPRTMGRHSVPLVQVTLPENCGARHSAGTCPPTLSAGHTTQKEPEGYKTLVRKDPTIPT